MSHMIYSSTDVDSDASIIMGKVIDTEVGVDAAGLIKRVGRRVFGLKPGDRVATLCRGAFRNLVQVHRSTVVKLPDGMTLEQGASLPYVYSTAYHALCNVAQLGAKETILIYGAAGGKSFLLLHMV